MQRQDFKTLVVSFTMPVLLLGCCIGERFFNETMSIDYSNFPSDTVCNVFRVSNYGVDSNYNNPFLQVDGRKVFSYHLQYDSEKDSSLLIIELPLSNRKDTFSFPKFSLKGQCKTDVYNQSLLVNGIRKYGKVITITP